MKVLDATFLVDYLDGVDALVAAVGRELDAPVVSADGDLTHPETRKVVDVEKHRD